MVPVAYSLLCHPPAALVPSRASSMYEPPQATLLAEKHGLKVCIIDPNLEKRWIPNYGVWVEEWEALDKDLQVHTVVHQCRLSVLSTLVLLRSSANLPFHRACL